MMLNERIREQQVRLESEKRDWFKKGVNNRKKRVQTINVKERGR